MDFSVQTIRTPPEPRRSLLLETEDPARVLGFRAQSFGVLGLGFRGLRLGFRVSSVLGI